MPCYTVSTATVQFGKNTDAELLRLALGSLGLFADNYVFNRETGELTYRTYAGDLATVKRAYSEQVVNATAKKNGWKVEWKTNQNGNRIAQVERISR
jgi:hypothetical protein